MRPRARAKLTVYRYLVPQGRDLQWFDLKMHEGAGVLSFQEEKTLTGGEDNRAYQHVISALVDTAASIETRRFRIAGFGEDLNDMQEKDYMYVGTIHSISGYGWHLFEVLA